MGQIHHITETSVPRYNLYIHKNFKIPLDGYDGDIYICGNFTKWKKVKMSKNKYEAQVDLNVRQGSVLEFFFVREDGTQFTSARYETKVDDTHGKINVLDLSNEEENNKERSKRLKAFERKNKPKSKDRVYSQKYPNISEYTEDPPVLPTTLIHPPQQDRSREDPSFLCVPSQTIISHMYSIYYDDAVVYSVTCKYNKKYVTTVYYRPLD